MFNYLKQYLLHDVKQFVSIETSNIVSSYEAIIMLHSYKLIAINVAVYAAYVGTSVLTVGKDVVSDDVNAQSRVI